MAEPKYDVSDWFLPIKGILIGEIRKEMGVPGNMVLRWLNGHVRPTRGQALELFPYFRLGSSDLNQILLEWNYSPLKPTDHNAIVLTRINRNRGTDISSRQVVESARATSEVRDQIDALEEKILSITAELVK